MNDDELIGYCDIHADTERALFNAVHIKRMFELAGRQVPEIVLNNPKGFWSMHEDMKTLVKEAREARSRPKLSLVP